MPPVEEEKNLVSVSGESREFFLHPKAAEAWIRLKRAAKSEGIDIYLVSAFRSISRQKEIVEGKRSRGIADQEIFKVSAPPGFSEHHSGRAVDMTTTGFSPLEQEFEKSDAFRWLCRRACEFGFSLSYPKENRFGIAYEPWHWLYSCKAQPVAGGDAAR